VKHWIAKIFHRVPAAEVMREQLFEAERLHVEHQAAAELHAGLAAVYRMRTERLRTALGPVANLRVAK
jgi:hypothetical protein